MTTVALILILFVALIFRAVQNLERTRKWCKSQLEKAELDFLDPLPAPHFFLLVPALREQRVIVRLLDRLCDLKYPPKKFEIIIALDEKERNDSSCKHTVDIVREYAERLTGQQPSLSFVEYTGTEQRKANQLNLSLSAARDRCRAMQRAEDECFVGVYDADSLPDRRVLAYISWWISSHPTARAFQQILDYRLNLDEIEKVRNSRLLKANTYYQTAWNGMFEVPCFLKARRRISHGRAPTFPPYCMGHGEFIRLDTLMEIGGFPADGYADGIELGFALTNINVAIEPIPLFDRCESPIDLKSLVHQHSLWFAGNLQIFRHVLKSTAPIGIIVAQLSNHLLLNLKWLLRPILWVAILSLLGVEMLSGHVDALSLAVAFLSVAALLAYGIASVNYVQKSGSGHVHGLSALFPIWVLVSAGFKSIGAWLGLFKLFLGIARRDNPSFPKMERN